MKTKLFSQVVILREKHCEAPTRGEAAQPPRIHEANRYTVDVQDALFQRFLIYSALKQVFSALGVERWYRDKRARVVHFWLNLHTMKLAKVFPVYTSVFWQHVNRHSRMRVLAGMLLFAVGALSPCFAQQKTIHLAAREGDVAVVRAALENGVSPNSFGSFSENPLHAAAARGHRDIIELLLDFGADRNLITNDARRRTALHLAAVNGHADIINTLFDYQPPSDPEEQTNGNIQDNLGNTPLHEAAIFGSQEMIDVLVQYGVDTEIVNNNNQTAVEICEGEECVVVDTGIRIVVPIELSYQISFEELGDDVTSQVINGVLTRLELGAAVGVLFPLGPVVSIGPEIGVSIPLIPFIIGSAIVHIPIRAVVNFAFSDTISLDTYLGADINIWSAVAASLVNMTFDIGARLNLAGFLITTSYALPFAANFSEGVGVARQNFWQNAFTIGLGFKLKGGTL